MRQILCIALAASALASAAAADPQAPTERPRQAVSAERYAVKASYNGGGHGYSDRARHIADCLATYPGYDLRTDRVRLPSGGARRCNL